jgi:hypothetical protein
LNNDIGEAEETYEEILAISPSDAFALKALKRIRDAKQLSPVTVDPQKRNIENLRIELTAKGISGYSVIQAPPNKQDIVVAVLGTGISASLKDDITDRSLKRSVSLLKKLIGSTGRDKEPRSFPWLLRWRRTARSYPSSVLPKVVQAPSRSLPKGIDAAVSHKANVLLAPLVHHNPIAWYKTL